MFKNNRWIKLPYIKQGLIYFTCINYNEQSQEVKNKINTLCSEIGKESEKALFELVTNEHATITGIAMKYYISERQLNRMKRKFYERWGKYKGGAQCSATR